MLVLAGLQVFITYCVKQHRLLASIRVQLEEVTIGIRDNGTLLTTSVDMTNSFLFDPVVYNEALSPHYPALALHEGHAKNAAHQEAVTE